MPPANLLLAVWIGVGSASCIAWTEADRIGWRAELPPRVHASAVGPRSIWSHRNVRDGQINVWSWATSHRGHAYIYVRDPVTCGVWGGPSALVNEDDLGFEFDTTLAGVAVELEPGRWHLLFGSSTDYFAFDKRDGEALLILIEPRSTNRTHYYYASREAQRRGEEAWAYDRRTEEMLAERCRKRSRIGTPLDDVRAGRLRPLDSPAASHVSR